MGNDKLSPMMQHYVTVKKQHGDAILMFRLGDFYEMFFEDAIKASAILDLTLTGRDCGIGKRAEMCGVPYHAVDNYIKRLVDNGFKVAICEQLNTPEEAKGKMVDRGVVRVITPGTLIDDALLDEKRSNYIASVYSDDNGVGLAFADISSGEFKCAEIPFHNLEDRLLSIAPSEIIANEKAFGQIAAMKSVRAGRLPAAQKYYEYAYNYQNAERKLKEQLKAVSLEAFELNGKKHATQASGALLEYFDETQKRRLTHFNRIILLKESGGLLLDYNARKNLELTETLRDKRRNGSLLWLLDKTVTNMGARRLRRLIENPLNSADSINLRLDAVDELVGTPMSRDRLTELLKSVRDLERLAGKISYGSLMPRDCVSILETLNVIPGLKELLSQSRSRLLKDLGDKLKSLPETRSLLAKAISDNPPALTKDGGYIKSGFNVRLDEYRNIGKNGKNMIAGIEAAEREATGIKNLKVAYNKVFGYYIEVTSSYKSLVPFRYHRRQTVANGERYTTEELKSIEEKIIGAEEKILKLEAELFSEIRSALLTIIPDLQENAEAITMCDVILSFSAVSKIYNFIKPVLNVKNKDIEITGGFHPVVRALSNGDFIPNDAKLDDGENRMLIITGPNMAGKSTYMRQIAIIVLMAHIGCFVPAGAAKIAMVDRIYTRIGASDDLGMGQSTFMTEMIEAAAILNGATDDSLILLDEIGRGTSTYDGLAIAWSILEYLVKHTKAKTLFSTHYHEIVELEGLIPGIKNYKTLVKEVGDTVQFLYKIARGGSNKSFGVKVAALAGLPGEIIDRAGELMKKLEAADINRDTNALMLAGAVDKKSVKQLSFMESENKISKLKDKIYGIIRDTDPNACSPIQALTILSNLKELAAETEDK